MVAFILHLGNVNFDDEEGNAVISSDETLQIIDEVCDSEHVLCSFGLLRCNCVN